jgi:hypothetical protein
MNRMFVEILAPKMMDLGGRGVCWHLDLGFPSLRKCEKEMLAV